MAREQEMKSRDHIIIAIASGLAALLLLVIDAHAGQPNKFQGALTVEQVVALRPALSFIREFTSEAKDQRWLFRLSSEEITKDVSGAPIMVNVGTKPSIAEVDIATTAAISEAYAIAIWVRNLHEKASPTPTPASDRPKLYF